MAVRYVRDEELIANALRVTRRGVRDVQRPSGTERALTTEVAQEALESAGDAYSLADGKLTVASTAPTLTDGDGKPVGALWMVKDGSGEIEAISEWDGTVWAERPLSQTIIPMIAAGKIEADAIDGMTITGATVRTSETGQRVQLDTEGLRAFNAFNTEVASIAAENAGLRIGLLDDARFETLIEEQIAIARVSDGFNSRSELFASIGVGMQAYQGSKYVVLRIFGTNTLLNSSEPLTIAAPSIELDGPVKFQGDTDWTVVSALGAVGGAPRVKYRQRDGLVQIIGRGAKPGSTYNLFTLPVGLRPSGTLRFPDMSLSPNFGFFEVYSNGLVASGNLNAATLDFNIMFEPA